MNIFSAVFEATTTKKLNDSSKTLTRTALLIDFMGLFLVLLVCAKASEFEVTINDCVVMLSILGITRFVSALLNGFAKIIKDTEATKNATEKLLEVTCNINGIDHQKEPNNSIKNANIASNTSAVAGTPHQHSQGLLTDAERKDMYDEDEISKAKRLYSKGLISQSEYNVMIENARYDKNQEEIERIQRLYDKGLISADEYRQRMEKIN